ncbi:hypothetical protein BGW38_008168 [Lunasporangiospora selenospora]|uniref:Tubulin-folding cofactor C n=1 Tax=Lunasporangiospora selenospora TaxID=979761 RepID=A0A9P6KGC5_9FUNG|nr:hypothetical protein BGW38_008168 [Lunasporangiospora selenospora]
MTTTEVSKDFRTTFDAEKQSIEQAITGLDQVAKAGLQKEVDSILQRTHALEKSVTEMISILPPYDARMCIEAIKSLSEQLNQSRTKLIPKQKFSFKSRKATGSPTPSSSSNTSSSAKVSESAPPSTVSTLANSEAIENQSKHLFMKFENRTNEHLFIGDLSVSLPMSEETRLAPKDVALTNLTGCTIDLSRMHSSDEMDIYLHVTSEPIIEDCSNMRFAPFGQILPAAKLDLLFEAALLNQEKNLYNLVKDFNWLRQQQSPHWRLMDPSEYKMREIAETVFSKSGRKEDNLDK